MSSSQYQVRPATEADVVRDAIFSELSYPTARGLTWPAPGFDLARLLRFPPIRTRGIRFTLAHLSAGRYPAPDQGARASLRSCLLDRSWTPATGVVGRLACDRQAGRRPTYFPAKADALASDRDPQADYEKSLDQVEATEELLRKTLFPAEGGLRVAYALVAEETKEGGVVVGLALYFFSYSTWQAKNGLYLEDLYVTPSTRGTGVGKALFRELGKIALEKECGRVFVELDSVRAPCATADSLEPHFQWLERPRLESIGTSHLSQLF
jgi:GNAT superfamily N-acetyltransferase